MMNPATTTKNKERYDAGVCIRCGDPNIVNKYKKQSQQAKQRGKTNKHCLCLRCYLQRLSNIVLGTRNRWEEILDLFNRQDGKCAYSGVPIEIGTTASIDHIIPCYANSYQGKRTTIENLQWVNLEVNYMKRDLSEQQFLEICKNITEHSSLKLN